MPAATRLFCLALWLTAALVALLRGANAADGVDSKKSSASWVPSVNAPTLCGVAFSFSVGGLAGAVGAALGLGVPGQHHVAGLGQLGGLQPVELLGRLHRAVGDHDAGLGRAAGAGDLPHVARDRGAAARRPQHGRCGRCPGCRPSRRSERRPRSRRCAGSRGSGSCWSARGRPRGWPPPRRARPRWPPASRDWNAGVLVSRRSRSPVFGEVARLLVGEGAERGGGPGQAEKRDPEGCDALAASPDEPDAAVDGLGPVAGAGDADLEAVPAGPGAAADAQGDQRRARRSCAARFEPSAAARACAPRPRCASGGAARCAPAGACAWTGRGGAWHAGCWRREAAPKRLRSRRRPLRRPGLAPPPEPLGGLAGPPPTVPEASRTGTFIVTPESVSDDATRRHLDVGVVVLGRPRAAACGRSGSATRRRAGRTSWGPSRS